MRHSYKFNQLFIDSYFYTKPHGLSKLPIYNRWNMSHKIKSSWLLKSDTNATRKFLPRSIAPNEKSSNKKNPPQVCVTSVSQSLTERVTPSKRRTFTIEKNILRFGLPRRVEKILKVNTGATRFREKYIYFFFALCWRFFYVYTPSSHAF